MPIVRVLRLFSVATLLVLGVPVWASAEEEVPAAAAEASASAAVTEAEALMEQRRYGEALTLLRRLTEGPVVDANNVFLLGLAATEAARQPGVSETERTALLDEAIAAFRSMLIERPDLVRVRLELARAFYYKGENDLARRHFEQVLAGDPPAPVVANVSRFLAEIRARRRWTLRAGFALAPDTNIGATSGEKIIYIGGLPFERDVEDPTTSGIGVSVWMSGEYQHPLRDRLRLRSGADVSRRDYAGSRFDQMHLAGHVGPRWFAGPNTEASLLASVQRRWWAGVPDSDALGARLEVAHRLNRRVFVNAQATFHDRQYRTRTYLDGPAGDLFLGGTWLANSTVRANAAAGWGRERTERERWRHERRWLRLGVSVALPFGFNVRGNAELRRTDYEGNWFPHTVGGVPREDRTRALRLSVHNRGFTWMGFSPQLSLVHEVRDTNAQLYDYRRTGGELSFVHVF